MLYPSTQALNSIKDSEINESGGLNLSGFEEAPTLEKIEPIDTDYETRKPTCETDSCIN